MLSDKMIAQCIFDLYDLRFGMQKEEVAKLFTVNAEDEAEGEALERANADKIMLTYDHEGRLWQVKAYYRVSSHEEAEALLEKMSRDYRFQTPTARVAFELLAKADGPTQLYVRYTEINLKRMYIHHMMALGAAKKAEAEEMERAIKEKEEEEYIPTGPRMF